MVHTTGLLIPIFVPLLVCWVIALTNQDRPTDDIEQWDNGLAHASAHEAQSRRAPTGRVDHHA